MNWVIVGAGAIGLLFYQALSRQVNAAISLRQSPQALPLNQLDFISTEGAQQRIAVHQATDQHLSQADVVMFCVKSYQLNQAVAQIIPKVSPSCNIIVSHNGMGTLNRHSMQLIGSRALMLMLTTHGSLKKSAALIQHTGQGTTDIGMLANPIDKKVQSDVLLTLSNSLAPVNWQNDIITMQWQKLAINCAINPLTAIYNVNNGGLADPFYQPIIDELTQEVCQLASASNVPLVYATTREKITQVIKNTAANSSSMRQDVNSHNKSEIDFITGFVVEEANKLGVAVPRNQAILHQFKLLFASF